MNWNNDIQKAQYNQTRRDFLRTTTKGLGAAAIGSLIAPNLLTAQPNTVPGS
ncbi:MAG: twin-arginine translocation signal domain-containing protein, partial [Bacteroidota bacterium]